MTPRRIAVVIPARDEEVLLPRCLRAIAAAVDATDVPTRVAVVLDRCTDDSAGAVEAVRSGLGLDVVVLHIRAGSVGAARSVGAAHLLRELGTHGTWLATTDADSAVPPHWLQAQLRHARTGAALVAGTVAVDDWGGRPEQVQRRAQDGYGRPLAPDGHGHVHGANLGMAATLYRELGGFASAQYDEDVSLVAAARHRGARVCWALDMAVQTSGRRHARAPRGFAAYLDGLAGELAEAPAS